MTRFEGGRCAGRNPSPVLGGIRLNGPPAPRAGAHRRLFALPPRRVGRLTRSRRVLNASRASSQSGGRSRFCPEPGLSPHASRRRGPAWWMEFPQAQRLEGRPPAHRPIILDPPCSICLTRLRCPSPFAAPKSPVSCSIGPLSVCSS